MILIRGSFSFAFTPIRIGDRTIIRPLLRTTIRYGNRRFKTLLLVDSGADYSMLRKETASFLGVDVSNLQESGKTRGIDGTPIPVSYVTCEIEVEQRGERISEEIPFQILLQEDADPCNDLLGREPFFYNYRIDFRMGYTDDKTLGKFVIYCEDKKKPAERYTRPGGFVKR